MISAAQMAARGAAGRQGRSRLRYLIVRREGNRLEVLTLAARSRRENLPVFTDAGAARDFLRNVGENWRVRESTNGELVSLLVGCLPHVDRIFVDPVFGVVGGATEPRSTTKVEFVAALMGEPLTAPAP